MQRSQKWSKSRRKLIVAIVNADSYVYSVCKGRNQAVLDTVRRASWEKIKNGSFASDLRSVHISRYAIKIPGEIVWYGHYGSSSAFKRYNMRCSFEIFLRKGGRNRRLLLASRNCYFLCRRDNFRDRKLGRHWISLKNFTIFLLQF